MIFYSVVWIYSSRRVVLGAKCDVYACMDCGMQTIILECCARLFTSLNTKANADWPYHWEWCWPLLFSNIICRLTLWYHCHYMHSVNEFVDIIRRSCWPESARLFY